MKNGYNKTIQSKNKEYLSISAVCGTGGNNVKKDIDWGNLGFEYTKTDKRFIAEYRNGAWSEGELSDDENLVINECAGVLHYAQECF